jgi:hypothetical protein
MDFKQFVEAKASPYVYHVTYYNNLDSISDIGLDYQEFGGSNFFKPHLSSHSRSGNFFCTDIDCVKYWISTLEHAANDRSDDFYNEGYIPIVIRFRLNRNKYFQDQHGELQGNKEFFTSREIPPEGIQVWSGKTWLPIENWSQINVDDFIDKSDPEYPQLENPYSRYGYPLPSA